MRGTQRGESWGVYRTVVASLGAGGVLFANDLTAMFAVLGRMFA